MKLVEIAAPDFDLAMTLDSGQVFHWQKIGDGFVGAIADYAVHVEQDGDVLKAKMEGVASATPGSLIPPVAKLVKHYFALDHPLAAICASFPNDPAMSAARDFCRGLRITRQPKWECLATFICSSMKQVAHIRQISKALRERFGVARKIDHQVVHTFPSAQSLAESSESELRKCALGYRAKNLLATARLVRSSEADLDAWSALSDADLREKYFPGNGKTTTQRLREFSETYFGDHGGYAQQYLFHYARTALREVRSTNPARAGHSASLRSK